MTPPGMVAVAVAVLAAALYWVPLSLSASLAHVLLGEKCGMHGTAPSSSPAEQCRGNGAFV